MHHEAAKTITTKANQKGKWTEQHITYNHNDSYQIYRQERTGDYLQPQNRSNLRYHHIHYVQHWAPYLQHWAPYMQHWALDVERKVFP